MKTRLNQFRALLNRASDALTLALYRFAARRCTARGLRPELLCQHTRGLPVTPATKKRTRKQAEPDIEF